MFRWGVVMMVMMGLLVACEETAEPTPEPPTPTLVPTSPPDPTDDPAATEAVIPPAPGEVPPGEVLLEYAGIVEARFPVTNSIPQIELSTDPEVGSPGEDDYRPAIYTLRITTGDIVAPVRGIAIVFPTDLEPGTYPIERRILDGFDDGAQVLANGLSTEGTLYDRAPQGTLELTSAGEAIAGSFVFTGRSTDNAAVTISGSFGLIEPGD